MKSLEPRISIITLGVSRWKESVAFYRDVLGFKMSSASQESIAFFQLGGIVLSLYPREELAKDAKVAAEGVGFSGFTIAYNVRTKEEVDLTLDFVSSRGGKIRKAAEDVFWGGRSGYFEDPDGYLWEVAWNPFATITPSGSFEIPD